MKREPSLPVMRLAVHRPTKTTKAPAATAMLDLGEARDTQGSRRSRDTCQRDLLWLIIPERKPGRG